MTEPILLRAANPSALTGRGSNSWLLDGTTPTLIDAGVGAPTHVDAVAAALGGRALARLLVTHGHGDHAGGVSALRARWPGLEACKFRLDDDDEYWRGLRDGDRIEAGNTVLTVVYTPGHARDHVCFWDAGARALYAGDMLVQGTTVMVPAGRGGGLRAYLSSLERLAALQPLRVYPGHGPAIDRPLELIAQYLDHRRMRERQVRACLAEGLTDPAAIVARLYPTLPDALGAAARATIEAHIEKLREEDR